MRDQIETVEQDDYKLLTEDLLEYLEKQDPQNTDELIALLPSISEKVNKIHSIVIQTPLWKKSEQKSIAFYAEMQRRTNGDKKSMVNESITHLCDRIIQAPFSFMVTASVVLIIPVIKWAIDEYHGSLVQ